MPLRELPVRSRYQTLGSCPRRAGTAGTRPVLQQKPGADLGLNLCPSETCPTLQSLAKGACGTGKGSDGRKGII